MNLRFKNRETYLTEAANLALDDKIKPIVDASKWDYERPNFRISIGFPKHTRGGKAVAVCFPTEASSDHVNEIFINPEVDDPIEVMGHMFHELIHAYDNCQSGHRNFFAHVARKVGLEGPLTATHPGEALATTLSEYSDLLGDFPHHRMVSDLTHKKDATRQRKVMCDDKSCGFLFRTSAKQIEKLGESGTSPCPACDGGYLEWDE